MNGSPKKRWAIALGAIALGVVVSSPLRARFSEAQTNAGFALAFVACGLWPLFSLAAFGPKTEKDRAQRVGSSMSNAGIVLFGVAYLLAPPQRNVVAGVALLLMTGWIAQAALKRWRSAPNASP